MYNRGRVNGDDMSEEVTHENDLVEWLNSGGLPDDVKVVGAFNFNISLTCGVVSQRTLGSKMARRE